MPLPGFGTALLNATQNVLGQAQAIASNIQQNVGTALPGFFGGWLDQNVINDLVGQGFQYDAGTGRFTPPQGYQGTEADFLAGVEKAKVRQGVAAAPPPAPAPSLQAQAETGAIQGMVAEQPQLAAPAPPPAITPPSLPGAGMLPPAQPPSFSEGQITPPSLPGAGMAPPPAQPNPYTSGLEDILSRARPPTELFPNAYAELARQEQGRAADEAALGEAAVQMGQPSYLIQSPTGEIRPIENLREQAVVTGAQNYGGLIPQPIRTGYEAVGDVLDVAHQAFDVYRRNQPSGLTAGPGAAAAAQVIAPREPWELALEATPLGLVGDVGALTRPVVRGVLPDIATIPRRSILEAPLSSPEAIRLTPTAGQTVIPRTAPPSVASTAPFGIRLGGGAETPDELLRRQLEESLQMTPEQLRARGPEAARAFETASRQTAQEAAQPFRNAAVERQLVNQFGGVPPTSNIPPSPVRGQPITQADLWAGEPPVPPRTPPAATAAPPPPPPPRLEAKQVIEKTSPRATQIWQRVLDEAASVWNIPRALKASFDLSAPGRQGLTLAFRHPQEWLQSWAPMIRAWASPRAMEETNAVLRAKLDRWSNEFGEDFVHLYETGSGATPLSRVPTFEGSKGFIADKVKKIPGLGNSERAYATFLNVQKVNSFDNMAKGLYNGGERNATRFQNIGDIVDHATGFGGAPLKDAGGWLLWSQRWLTSRFQFLAEPIVQAVIRSDMRAARQATENLVAFAGGSASLAVLINESGLAEIEMDPRSSNFGKIRVGPTRVDFGGGFLPMIRAAAQAATGERISSAGDINPADAVDVIQSFFENKLSPGVSELYTRFITGENPIGEPPTRIGSTDFFRDMVMPLIADSILESYEQTGDPLRAGLTGAAELVGGGVSTYTTPGEMRQTALEDIIREGNPELTGILQNPTTGETVTQWSQLDSWQKAALQAKDPELAEQIRAAEEESDSEWVEVDRRKQGEIKSATDTFRQDGNADRLGATLGNIGDKYSQEYAVLDAESDFGPSANPWVRKVSEFWDSYNQMVDPEARDRAMTMFEGSLNPAEKERWDGMMSLADDPIVGQRKKALTYIEEKYWSPREQQYQDLINSTQEGSKARKYTTYEDLANAAASKTNPDFVFDQKLKSVVDSQLSDKNAVARKADPQLDALLFIWGYTDSVVSKEAQAAVEAWGRENGIPLVKPPPRGR